MREMLNKATFIMNVLFMIINNSTFIVQWIVLFSLKDDIGGYGFKQIFLLWGIAAGTYGVSHFFFKKSYSLAETITNGKLDSYLVQPKNVLLAAITSEVDSSAIGDMLYGIIMIIASGFTISKFLLFIILAISGGFTLTAVAVITASLSFWITRSEAVADLGNRMMTNLATYPDGIFNITTKIIFFTLIPIGFVNHIPVWVLDNFNLPLTLASLGFSTFIVTLAFIIFYKGLKNYSSSNLMISKI